MSEEIGSLRVNLGTNVVAFKDELVEGQRGIASFAKAVGDQLRGLEETIKKISVGLTVGITAPFAAMSAVSAKGAGGFEAAMNKVQAAIAGIDPKQLAEMSKQARELGPAVGRNAVEAAQGIETLALAGMSAKTILGGGLASTMKLAGANAANLESAAAAVTDVMAQFGKVSADLPPIVDKITGALDNSKFGFEDFQLAISQAGGVAGAAGVSFEDFNTAIAGTSALFASGSDAGTSFKTFITSLNPKSKEAAGVMEQLGLKFFDASGKMKDLAVIAEDLQKALGGLSDKSKNEALTKMFGTDAMRTAIGLMSLGKKGFDELQTAIAGASAGDKLAVQMQGYEAATNRLSAAFLNLKIAVGDTGLLNVFTSFTQGMTGFVSSIANAPPLLLQIGVSLWAVAAALGPLGLAVITLAKVGVVLFVSRLGLLGSALVFLINPIGFMAAKLVSFAVAATGATSALTLFATALARVLGPLGLLITAMGLLYFALNQQTTASGAVTAAMSKADKAMAAYEEAAMAAANATGQARVEAMKLAAMKRQEAANSIAAAKASLADARAKMQQAQAAMVARNQLNPAGDRSAPGVGGAFATRQYEQAAADEKALKASVAASERAFKTADSIIAAAAAVDPGKTNIDFGDGEGGKKKGGAKDTASGVSAADLAARREELKLRQQLDVASARGDLDEQKRLQDLIALKAREREYEDAGLKTGAARLAAAQDMRDLRAAEAEDMAKQVALAEDTVDLDLSRIREDFASIRRLENREYLNERITFWQSKGLTLLQAQDKAAGDLAHTEAARAERLENENAARAKDREVGLARLRSDSVEKIRALEREAELQRRVREYQDAERMSQGDATDRANKELDEEDRARLQGDFRSTFREGVRAALDGDLKGFVKNWWTDRLSRSFEDALNSIADMLLNMFKGAGQAGGEGAGGGFFGSIAKLFGSVGGPMSFNANTVGAATSSALNGITLPKIPGFATGGSFEVGGRSGIDNNLIQFRATKGEMVNIRRPGNDNGGSSRVEVVPSPYFNVVVDGRAVNVMGQGAPALVGASASTAMSKSQQRAGRRLA